MHRRPQSVVLVAPAILRSRPQSTALVAKAIPGEQQQDATYRNLRESHGTELPFSFRAQSRTLLNRSSGHDECRPCSDKFLHSLCTTGHLDRALDALSRLHTSVSDATYMCLLKACIKSKLLTHVKKIHAHIAHHRPWLTGLLGGYVVVTLAKCGAPEDAAQVSHTLSHRTVFSWTAIIAAYVERGSWHQALQVQRCMQEDGIEPDSHTFVNLFKACGGLSDLAQGKILHADAHKKGLALVIFVGNTIVSMYGKCGAVLEAEDVFRMLSEPNVVSWNAMLSALIEQRQGERALLLYRQMQKEGVTPNLVTYVTTLQACGILAEKGDLSILEGRQVKIVSLMIGQAVHAEAGRKGFGLDVLVGTTLVSMYKKCGDLSKAENMFTMMIWRNLVSWTAMISAYVEHGHGERALCFYKQMQVEGMSPNQLTYLFALQACGIIAEKSLAMNGVALEIGRGLHADAGRDDFLADPSICSSLLSVYGKCGALEEAEGLFNTLTLRNVVSWTAMLSAYVEQGQGKKALQLYKRMQEELVTLDVVILLCVLQACSKTGSLEVCDQIHFELVSAGHGCLLSVAATLIHAYGGCASTANAQAVFDGIVEPNVVLWNACIAGHAGEGNIFTSLQMFEQLKLAGHEPDEVTFTAVLSSCTYIGDNVLGLQSFVSMIQDSGVNPDLRHYGSMVDLLGRTGNFHGVDNMLRKMSTPPDFTIWFCLLGACRIHGNVELATQAFDQAVNLQPKWASAYVMMSNIYAEAGLHERSAEVEKTRVYEGAWEAWPELE
eukprot:c18605_g1_i1 orf=96-2426(+)